MPQLDVERNVVVLLGSYLTNLNLQLQRMAPVMSRAGDLMQRESQITSQADRLSTQRMVNQIGQALEDISRATGAVAHLYKNIDLGSSGSQARVQLDSRNEIFEPII